MLESTKAEKEKEREKAEQYRDLAERSAAIQQELEKYAHYFVS